MKFTMIKCDICGSEYEAGKSNKIMVITHPQTVYDEYREYTKDICCCCYSNILDTVRERWKNGRKLRGKTIELDKFKEEFKW